MKRIAYPAQRTGFRFRLPCPVSYCAGPLRGEARLVDISASGCRVERASHPLPPGTRALVSIRLSDRLGLLDCELSVVRATPDGFAGRFSAPDPNLALKLLNVAKAQSELTGRSLLAPADSARR